MPKRISKRKPDTVQNARRVVLESVTDTEHTIPTALEVLGRMSEGTESLISRVMAEMGRKGGLIGDKRRLVTLSSRRRSQIAKLAAHARWSKKKKKSAA